MFTIYLITNTVNGKCYVGVTKNAVSYRFRQHIRHAAQGKVPSALYQAIQKYGVEAFTVSEITQTSFSRNAWNLERWWIARYESFGPRGYNLTPGGDVAFCGPKSLEHKRKIGAANRGRSRPDLSTLNRQRKGVRLTTARRQRISEAQFIWRSCLKCRRTIATTEFNRHHNTNKHFGLPHGNTGRPAWNRGNI